MEHPPEGAQHHHLTFMEMKLN